MLEMLREYAAERLARNDETVCTRNRHAYFYLRLGEQAGPATWGPDAAVWWQRLDDENHNIRAALRWLIDHEDAERTQRLGATLVRFARPNPFLRGSRLDSGAAWD